MIFLNRLILFSLILCSCSSIDYVNVPIAIYNAYKSPEKINLSQEYINSQNYSFSKVKLGNGNAILVLSSISNGVYEWVSANNEKIYTYNGRIIKTVGLPYNINVITPISQIDKPNNLMMLSNPDALIDLKQSILSKKTIDLEIDQNNFKSCALEEKSYVFIELRMENRGYICKTINNEVIYTRQKTHPYLDEIEMYFYYKY